MAIKDNPGIQTMPKSTRDWTKFINDLSGEIADAGSGGSVSWSDPVDASIIPDATGTRDIGSATVRFDDVYATNLNATGDVVLSGLVDTRDVSADGAILDGLALDVDDLNFNLDI